MRSRAERFRLLAGATLLAGLTVSAAVFLRAEADAATYALEDTSKVYLRDLERYGGTANLLATQFREWFGSLWHGKRLAYTIAVASALASSAVFYIGPRLPPPGHRTSAP